MKPATVNHSRLLKAAAQLKHGSSLVADRIIAENPNGSNSSWSGVFRKLRLQRDRLHDDSSPRIDKPAFSVFAKGNSKLPFYAFSSMAILDCAGYGECGVWCYSKQAWRNPNAAGRQISNSMLLASEKGRRLIEDEFMKLPKGIVFRLYVDGDFDSKATLKFWMELLKRRPDIQAYGYSKSWVELVALHLDGYEWPKNYLLNLSSGSRHDDGLKAVVAGLPITRGEFIAVPVDRRHIKSGAYKSRHAEGFTDYAKAVRSNSDKPRLFVCSGQCGDCLPAGRHACGDEKFRNVPIAIGVH